MTAIPVGQVGYDDLCGLQQYFDTLASGRVAPPRVVSGSEIEGLRADRVVRGGRTRFAFETDFQVAEAKRVLEENWRRLPQDLASASHLEIEVQWSQKADVHRVVTDRDAVLYLADRAYPLPYHVCLSEFLFGEPLYRERHRALGLPALPSILVPAGGVAPAGARPDAGAPAPAPSPP